MPQFYKHTPKSQADMAAERKRRTSLPVGLIGVNSQFSYGYNGSTYYVTEYSIFDYFVTKTELSFEEAKALFEALTFAGNPAPKPIEVTRLIREARRKKLSGDELFWFFEGAF